MKNYHRINLIITFFMFFLIVPVKQLSAQDINPGEILRSGVNDSNLLLDQYLRPFGPGLAAGLNSGWFTGPRPHRLFGFDFRISSTFAMVPDFDKVINMDRLVFEHLSVLDGPVLSPTLFGEELPGTRLGETFTNPETGQTEELYSFTMPTGTDFHYVVTPMAQFTMGLIKDTDITVRYLPSLNFNNDFKIGVMGVGIQHGLNQWLNQAPDAIDASIHIGYTEISADFNFLVEPTEDTQIQNPHPASTWEGQGMEVRSNALTTSLILGKQLPIISLYGGIGFQQAKTTVIAAGSYPAVVPLSPNEYTPGGANRTIEKVDDPIDLEFESNLKMNYFLGGRIRLAIVAVSISYNFSEYNALNIGVGISIR
jgi:hypothetical protein